MIFLKTSENLNSGQSFRQENMKVFTAGLGKSQSPKFGSDKTDERNFEDYGRGNHSDAEWFLYLKNLGLSRLFRWKSPKNASADFLRVVKRVVQNDNYLK